MYRKQSPFGKWLRKHKLLTVLLLLFLLLVGSLFLFYWSKLNLIVYEDEVDTTPYVENTINYAEESLPPEELAVSDSDVAGLPQVEHPPLIPQAEVKEQSDVMNILLLGTDERSLSFSPYSRSDSMILVSINRKENTVKLVSLQRGMGVPVLEGEYEGQYDWLTHMFRYGGADLVRKTVEICFRVKVDHYVRVNMHSVTQIIDLVDGVDVYMNGAEVEYFNTCYAAGAYEYPVYVGVNRLYGTMALHYARLREIDDDFSRVERQRKVILAVVERLKDADLLKLNEIADQVLPLVQTNLTKAEITELLLYAPSFLNASFAQMTLPVAGTYGSMRGMGGRILFAVDFEANSEALREFLYLDSE